MSRVTDRNSGILVSDQRLDQVLLLRDLDGDAAATASGEATVFFDASNESGLASPTENVFAVHQAVDQSVYVGDGTTDAVYRLRDKNGDGDAQDAGEAAIWFSADNADGFSLVTPNGIAEGADGAIYISNAGTASAPEDAVYRTVDLNGDGDANDAGEATLWLDVQTIIDTSVPFDLNFDGSVAYLNDLTGAATDVIYRIEDMNSDGQITPDEVVNFISDDMNFGAPVDISSTIGSDGALYTLTWFPDDDALFKVYRLKDLDGSGQIDTVHEAVEIWNGAFMPGENPAEIGFSITAGEAGGLILTANSFGGAGAVVALQNKNGDGDFFDQGETVLVATSADDGPLDRPRAVEAYESAPQAVQSTVGAGNHFSTFLRDGVLYSSGENVVSQLGNGVAGFDVKAPLPVRMPEGFEGEITSVAGGLLHTTFLTDEGDVYAFGFNNRGPLGLGDEEARSTPVKIDALDDVVITGIENGNGTSFAIAADGTLYAWGSNTNGQLGLGDREERLLPTVVEALADERVLTVSAGVTHTLVLTESGSVYGFGSNTDHQVSPSEERRVIEPTQIEGLPDDIVAISGEGRTSYAIGADGRVWGWGESRTGQLLQGSDRGDGTFTPLSDDVERPILLEGLPEGVIDIQGGARWSAALTAEGNVYLWGPNDQGPTGGLDEDPDAESDAAFFPTRIETLDEVRIVEIQTGPNSIIAVSDTGAIYTWGSNSDGRLGFASSGSVFTPMEVDFDADAAPFLLSATPADNARDVSTDAAFVLTFTEAVAAAEGKVTFVNRDTGERLETDVTDTRLVGVEGAVVTITPPAHLDADARYAVEITDGAFVDLEGQAFEGIAVDDVSTFNITTAEEAVEGSGDLNGTPDDDLLRGGSGDEFIRGRGGDDVLSGNGGDDRLSGNWGADSLFGGTGRDRLNGGWGEDTLYGGAGDDRVNGGRSDDRVMGGDGDDRLNGGLGNDRLDGDAGDDRLTGGLGNDVFVFSGGDDFIRDFDRGNGEGARGVYEDHIEIALEGVDEFGTLIDNAVETRASVILVLGEEDSLTLRGFQLADLNEGMFSFI